MFDRFQLSEGKENLIFALRQQGIVRNDELIAQALVNYVTLNEYVVGSIIISQESSDNNLHFILSGRVVIRINDRDIAYRNVDTHIGEMALIEPSARRSASAIAVEPTITASITQKDFIEIANNYPVIWQYLAMELGNRLRERSKFVSTPNAVPEIFIGSSSESIHVVDALVKGLNPLKINISPWNGDIFWPSKNVVEDLESRLFNTDFAIFVFGPDDTVISRSTSVSGPRDNVLLECGMFLGAIGRERTYFLKPANMDIKLPSDFLGLKYLEYEYDNEHDTVDVILACREITRCVNHYGVK